MSFGLRKAAQTSQRFMDDILRGLDFCFTYLEDNLVFSRSLKDHEQHLRALCTQLQRYMIIIINPAKCIFRALEVTFIDYKVSAEGSQPLKERMTHLQDCHTPKTASQLRRFLGMLNFYRRFLPHAAATQAPLHDVIYGPRVKGSHPITWIPELLTAFEESKASLSRATLLAHLDPSAPLAPVTDASTSAMGVVLQQHVENVWQLRAFFSKKILPCPKEVQRLLSRAAGHLRGRKAFPPYAGSAPLPQSSPTTSPSPIPSSRSWTNAHRGS
jgi:cleavage and polyadenylation specificity factor subunit 1